MHQGADQCNHHQHYSGEIVDHDTDIEPERNAVHHGVEINPCKCKIPCRRRIVQFGKEYIECKKKINAEMKELFNYETGVNPDDKPPMFTFNVDEVKIKEHKL